MTASEAAVAAYTALGVIRDMGGVLSLIEVAARSGKLQIEGNNLSKNDCFYLRVLGYKVYEDYPKKGDTVIAWGC